MAVVDGGWPVWWLHDGVGARTLAPLAALTRYLAGRRLRRHLCGTDGAWQAPVPVIVVGNLSVGGNGKTPMVMALVQALRRWGFEPGVVCRGHGGRRRLRPCLVHADADPAVVGDEALLLALRCNTPVAAGRDRPAAARLLLDAGVDVIVSDDGLQHHALGRDLEIVMVDGQRGFGNGRCLPAGPLREGRERLQQADFIVITGPAAPGLADLTPHRLLLRPEALLDADGRQLPLSALPAGPLHAVAAIGHPQRFFRSLEDLGADILCHPFGDHRRLGPRQLDFGDDLPIVMTEKDMVRCCREMARWPASLRRRCLALQVTAEADAGWLTLLQQTLRRQGCIEKEG